MRSYVATYICRIICFNMDLQLCIQPIEITVCSVLTMPSAELKLVLSLMNKMEDIAHYG